MKKAQSIAFGEKFGENKTIFHIQFDNEAERDASFDVLNKTEKGFRVFTDARGTLLRVTIDIKRAPLTFGQRLFTILKFIQYIFKDAEK